MDNEITYSIKYASIPYDHFEVAHSHEIGFYKYDRSLCKPITPSHYSPINFVLSI